MSHSKERKEKICLNCQAELNGRFCHLCGQENLEPRESVWSLISHFFYDITHFDGKFFTTVGYLFRKPGFLSKEYLRGRRASYLNPIKMYVFSSGIFFIFFFSLFNPKKLNFGTDTTPVKIDTTYSFKNSEKESALKAAKSKLDSIKVETFYRTLESQPDIANEIKNDSSLKSRIKFGEPFETRIQYDSLQKALPLNERHGWFRKLVNYRRIELYNKYKDEPKQFLKDGLDGFIHMLPYLLFVSLPLYAVFLKLLYIRRKQFYFVNHGIFLIHLYIFTFLILLLLFSVNKLDELIPSDKISFVQGFLILFLIVYGIFYTIKAMRNFYGQGWGKTLIKFFLFNFLAFNSLVILFCLFIVLTVFRL